MTVLKTALFALALAAPAAWAQTSQAQTPPPAKPAAAAPVLPRLYAAAGYRQPDVPCRVISAAEARCTFPAMTAGRYSIEAASAATASGANANHTLQIVLAERVCPVSKWPFTGKGELKAACRATILADAPLEAVVRVTVENGVADPNSLRAVVVRLPWDGVLDTLGVIVRPDQAAAAKK